MSLQEAASSGSFKPHAAQPSDPQRTESPFNPSAVERDVDQAMADSATPFGGTYEFAPGVDDAMVDGGEPDMRATRRRAWTVVGLAIVIPAAVAAVIAWQLFGTDSEPAPTVTRVTTTPATQVTQQAQATTTAPVQSTVATTTETPSTASATAASTTTVATSAETASAAAEEQTAATGTDDVDLASLDPAARLAAWTEIETIQVLPGETLWLIAQNYGTTISAIATLNGITDPSTLSIGQQLMIPVGFAEEIAEVAPAEAAESATVAADQGSPAITAAATDAPPLTDDLANWHTIAPVEIEEGDSLVAIAVANNTTMDAIMALNGLTDPNLILIGDVLLVPVGYQGDASPTLTTTQSQVQVDSGASTSGTTGDELEDTTAGTTSQNDDDENSLSE
ncbi:MAG: LysM domain-containing protein [Chloroflexi bacterium]|nr:LysM domain-containing protein [Chloroflexota bacterium]